MHLFLILPKLVKKKESIIYLNEFLFFIFILNLLNYKIKI